MDFLSRDKIRRIMATQPANKARRNPEKKNTAEEKQKRPGSRGVKSQQRSGKKGNPGKKRNAV
jgi:hypothetical protein